MSTHAPPPHFKPRPRTSFMDAIAPGDPPETRRDRHVRLLTDVRDRLAAVLAARGLLRTAPHQAVLCRLHGLPWTECPTCSTTRRST